MIERGGQGTETEEKRKEERGKSKGPPVKFVPVKQKMGKIGDVSERLTFGALGDGI